MPLEAALDETVHGALAAGADQHALDAVGGGVFGHQLGGVLTLVVDGDDGYRRIVAELEEAGEGALGGKVGVEGELLGPPLVGEADLADEADDQGSATLAGEGEGGGGEAVGAVGAEHDARAGHLVGGQLLEDGLAEEAGFLTL